MKRTVLLRWYASFGSFGVPQAAAPIAFALVALPLTGDANDGATMILAMTVAQLVGAIPLARWGRRYNTVNYVKSLILVRAIALTAVAVLAPNDVAFGWLIVAAAFAGLVNGAAYGLHRTILNHLVSPMRLPRALGIAATTNELVFVSAPVLASALGAVSPIFAIVIITVLGSGSLLLLPHVAGADRNSIDNSTPASKGRLLTPEISLWLLCTVAIGAAVAAVEIGAVTMAVDFGLEPTFAFIFPVALCIASVSGGIWVSVRNRHASPQSVLRYLLLSTVGSLLIAWHQSISLTIIGSLLVGFYLPLLATHCQLSLDRLAPAERRAEAFALLRNANAVGIIVVSMTLSFASLVTTLWVSAVLIFATALLALASFLRQRGQ